MNWREFFLDIWEGIKNPILFTKYPGDYDKRVDNLIKTLNKDHEECLVLYARNLARIYVGYKEDVYGISTEMTYAGFCRNISWQKGSIDEIEPIPKNSVYGVKPSILTGIRFYRLFYKPILEKIKREERQKTLDNESFLNKYL